MFIDVGWFWLFGALAVGFVGGWWFSGWCWSAGGRYIPPEWDH